MENNNFKITKDIMLTYITIVNEYMSNPAFVFSERERNIINSINKIAKEDENVSKLLEKLRNTNDKNAVIEEYFNPEKEIKSEESVENAISNTFGIDISDIDHKYLNNGKEIFSFYDINAGRNVLLENYKNGVSLVEQLKEIQSQNSNFQTSNDEKNVTDMLNDKIIKENCELSLVPIKEVPNRLQGSFNLSLEDYYKILFLYKNADYLNFDYINFENIVAVDKDGKIFEVYKDDSYEYQIGEPNSANYIEEKINVSDRVDSSYTSSEQNVALQSNYEDIPREVEYENVEIKFDNLSEEVQEKTVMFYEMPYVLNDLTNEQKKYWLENIELYEKKLKIEEERLNHKGNVNVRRLVLDKEKNNKGNIDFVSITFILGIIFTIISMVIIFTH